MNERTSVKGTIRVMCLVERIFNIFEIEFFSKSLILILFQSVIIILAHETYKIELLSTKTQLKSLSTKRTERLWNQIIFFFKFKIKSIPNFPPGKIRTQTIRPRIPAGGPCFQLCWWIKCHYSREVWNIWVLKFFQFSEF